MQKRLTLEEREQIYYYIALNKSFRDIGLLLNRSHTTISREFNKNRKDGVYTPSTANNVALLRYKKCGRRNKIDNNIELFDEIFQKYFKKWSPEQISNYLKDKFNGNLQMQISHESIYKFIYAHARGELKKHLLKYMRQKRKLRKDRKLSHEKRGQIPNLISIHERPKEIESRSVPGHWEADLLMGKNHKTALGVLVERSTRFVILAPLKGKKAEDVKEAFAKQFEEIPDELKASLTYDRGKEMILHKQFTEDTNIPGIFCRSS